VSDFNKIKSLSSAVLFLVYNRPQNTKKVFKSLSQVKPTRLYIACDGPKKGRAEDMRRVSEVRDIVNLVDWNCEVKTLFQDTNLGCKLAVELAITWFFDHEEFGIILEDDCLPNNDFYYFCENLLLKYRNDDRVYAITGDNFQQGTVFGNASYYFSKYVHVWGWATWRRAWKHYDKDLSFWPSWKKSSEWEVLFTDKKEKKYWYKYCEKYIFPKDKLKIHTTPLWIPPVNKMLEYITKHNFKLDEVIELKDVEINDFSLYVFKKN